MIEANEPTQGTVVKQVTPAKITTTQIIEDLENGIDRTGIQTKYGLESWEVKQMFMHPTLKGKKAKKVRKLSFEFVDDTDTPEITGIPNGNTMSDTDDNEVDPNQTSIPVETTESFHGTVENDTNTQFTQF